MSKTTAAAPAPKPVLPTPAPAAAEPRKTTCPITREEFGTATPIPISIAGSVMSADPKEFSTGSLGWNYNGKAEIEVAGKRVKVQVGLNLTIIGSKEI